VEPDGGRPVVASAGGFVGFLDSVVVVSGAFDGAGAGAFAAGWDQQFGDVCQVLGQFVSPVLRGECPPFRWQYGG
jgi:hypothetical protein